MIAASVEAKRLALLRPGEWQLGIRGELGECQARRLAAFEHGESDVRGKISQPEHAGKVGAIERLALGELAVLAAAELHQLVVEQMRPDDQLDEAWVRAGGCGLSRIDPQRDFLPG